MKLIKIDKNSTHWEFLGGFSVRILGFLWWPGFNLWSRTEIPKAMWCGWNKIKYMLNGNQESQSSIVVQLLSPLRLCVPMDCSTPGFPVLHYPLEFAQTHIHWVGDAIQPSCLLSPPSPPAFNLSQHQGLFQWVGSLYQVAKELKLQLQHQSFQFRVDFLWNWLVWSPCCPRDSQEASSAPQFENINSLVLSLLWATLVAQKVKNPPAMRETWVRSLGWEDPLEEGRATHSSILVLENPHG